MTLARSAKRFLDLYAAGRNAAVVTDALALRRGLNGLSAFAGPEPEDVDVRRFFVAGPAGEIPVRAHIPREFAAKPSSGLVHLHGGGWISGGGDGDRAFCSVLARAARCRILAVDFRLAPEHRFPAGLDDARAVLTAALARPENFALLTGKIGVSGVSSGGGTAALLALDLRGFASPPALQVLLCPVLDPLARRPSRAILGQGRMLEEAAMQVFWDAYRTEDLSPDDPRVTPLARSDVAGAPPAIIHVAEEDPLVDEGELYAVRLAAAGVAVEFVRHAGMIHDFFGLGAVIPEAAPAIEMLGRAIFARFS